MSKLTPEEKEEVAARKRHKSINRQIRGARGVTVEVPIGTPEVNESMGSFIRASTGRINGKAAHDVMVLKREAVRLGYVINEDGEILHDIRSKKERKEQEADGN